MKDAEINDQKLDYKLIRTITDKTKPEFKINQPKCILLRNY